MNSIACVICGTKKGDTNNWLVLFEAECGRAVVIGPIEEAETLRQWQPGMIRVHICGAGCLYRKLNSILHPAASEKPPQATLRSENGMGVAAAATDEPRIGAEAALLQSEEASSPRISPVLFRGLLRRAADPKPASPAPAFRAADVTVSRNEKSPPKLRQIASIQQGVTIFGQIQSKESLYVNGELAGTLELTNHRLTVGPNGRIRAAVQAREVEVLGMIEGEVRADKIVVRKNATLRGDICTVVLVIEEGAFFEGKCSKAAERYTSGAERLRELASR